MIDANGIYQDIFDYDFSKSLTLTILSPDEVSTELDAHMQLQQCSRMCLIIGNMQARN